MMAKNQKSTTNAAAISPGNTDHGHASAATDGDQTGAPAVPTSQSRVLARVLAHCYLGEPDDIVEIDTELAPSVSDLVDTDPAAVEYAQSLKA